MANTSGASLSPIYTRLNSVPEYHPLEADTFADWSVEAGDLVTVTRDGKSYKSPVHQTNMNWKRGQQISLSSTGKKERDAISRMSQQKYARGGSGLRNESYWHKSIQSLDGRLVSGLELTESHAYLYSKDLYNQMESGLMLTASAANLYSQDLYRQMRSGLELTSSSAHLYSSNLYKQMTSGLKLSESSAILYADSKTNRAYIMARINAKGEGEALINADRIQLTGGSIKLNDAISVVSFPLFGAGAIGMKKPTVFTSSAGFQSNVTFAGSSSSYILNAATIGSMIKTVRKSGNTLTLTRFDGTSENFSKAVTISGSWSGGTLTVSQDPNGSDTYVRTLATDTVSWAADYKSAQIPIIARYGSQQQYSQSTGWSAYINTNPAWQAGYTAGGGGAGNIDVNTGGGSYHVPQESGLNGLAYAMGTSQNNLVPIFGGATVSSGQYYGFKVTCGSANPKYYYFVT